MNDTTNKGRWHRWAAPQHFLPLAERLLPWLSLLTALLLGVGIVWGLGFAPPDYQQGQSYRIIFVHVPSAWMSLFAYVAMAGAGAVYLIWRIRLADMFASAAAPLGAWFTFLALATGSLWGRPMWGTWWEWDPRLTSELILLFLYLGVMALRHGIDDPQRAARAAALLALIGVVNVPIIHFSVEWWNSLHQPATVAKFGKPSMHPSMLWPLLLCALGFMSYFAVAVVLRIRCAVMVTDRRRRWLAEVYGEPRVQVRQHPS